MCVVRAICVTPWSFTAPWVRAGGYGPLMPRTIPHPPARLGVSLILAALFAQACPAPRGGETGDSEPDSTIPSGTPDLGISQAANDSDYFWFARESIEAAQTRVHVIEYLLYDTGLAEQLLLELVDAAERGVEVKLLADETVEDTAGNLDWLRDASGGAIQAALDSTGTVSHNKLIIADSVTLVGSHNMSSSALSANHEASMYMVEADVTDFYEAYFQSMWADSDIDPSIDKPDRDDIVPIKNDEIGGQLLGCLSDAQERVRLVMYAVSYRPGDSGDVTSLVNSVVQAHDRGVDVQVVLDQSDWIESNDINDEAIALFQQQGVALRLAERGVTTHAKMLLCDDTIIVGDANWSYSSMELYNGTSVAVTRPAVAAQYLAWFDEIWEEGEAP
jgi:phosphatidylserine/phosphatidylglycerophosphate/cardiolipin synthase-like enzyme